MTLEHHAAIQAGAFDFAPVHEHIAVGSLIQSGQHVEDGGLAAAGVADNADELAFVETEVDVFKHGDILGAARRGKDFFQSFDLKEGLVHTYHS